MSTSPAFDLLRFCGGGVVAAAACCDESSIPWIEMADLVTEFEEAKHPFRAGFNAQKGVEH